MLQKTTGIVLHQVKYNESSVIATVYTRHFGRSSYMVYGPGRKKAAFKSSMLQALTLLDLNVSHQPGKDIQQIKDVKIAAAWQGIPADPIKNAIALFIAELLYKSLRQPEPDEQMFNYLENAVRLLEVSEDGIANFHLVFMMILTRYLGFAPSADDADKVYFDMLNGVFLKVRPLHSHYLGPEDAHWFRQLLHHNFNNLNELKLLRTQRQNLLQQLVEYYKLHLPEFHGLNSIEILKELFD